jgi:hypothetical protein
MARVSIYVPDELKARMDRAGELNWSAAAQRAFEIELNQARWKMVENEIDRVADRLRASKLQEDEANRNAGHMFGQKWARDLATYGELERIATYEHWDQSAVAGDYEVVFSNRIFDAVDWRDVDPSDRVDLWEKISSRRVAPAQAWLEGFVEGATEVWNEVADKV